MTRTEHRRQIIHEAMTGQLGSPFVPDARFLEREIDRRMVIREIPQSPLSSEGASDGLSLHQMMGTVEARLRALQERIQDLTRRLDLSGLTASVELSQMRSRGQQLLDRLDLIEQASPLSPVWTPSIGDHFRTADQIDLLRSTAAVDHGSASVSLPVRRQDRIDPGWTLQDTADIQVLSGAEHVTQLSVLPNSPLRVLTDGSPSTWGLAFVGTGSAQIQATFPLARAGNPVLSRVELSLFTPTNLQLVIVRPDGTETSLTTVTWADNRVIWNIPPQPVSALRLVWTPDQTQTLLVDDLGLYLETYHTDAIFLSESLALTPEHVLSRVSVSVGEEVGDDTSLTYFVGLDPLASGAFIDTQDQVTSAGPLAVLFDPDASGFVPSSELRQWSHLPGASGYAGWEPVWHPIRPVTRPGIGASPRVVEFEHLVHHTAVSGLADLGYTETEYEGTHAGWWRPGVNQDEVVPTPSTAFPEFAINNVDFFKIFYWPGGEPLLDPSIRLSAGTKIVDGVIASSGALWSAAQQLLPGLVDFTDSNLIPDASGTLTVLASGEILFDRVRDLRFQDSHDPPFVRGEDYRVYGSGNMVELDVSPIEAISDVFGTHRRAYTVTYTVERSEGTIETYTYQTVAWVAPGVSASMTITQTDRLRDVRVIEIGTDDTIDTVERIESPAQLPEIHRTLSPGYTRIVLSTTTPDYDPTQAVLFDGPVATVEVPNGLAVVPAAELFGNTRKTDPTRCAVVPAPSGGKWLVVNDPGGVGTRRIGDVLLGDASRSDEEGRHLFHDTASGLLSFYTLDYDVVTTPETRLLFRADLNSQDPQKTPVIHWYRIDASPTITDLSLQDILHLPIDTRGIA